MTRTRCYIHLLVFYICPICSVGTDVQEDTRWQRHSTAVSLSYSQFSTITDTLELEAVLHRYEACHEAVSIKFFVRHVHGSLFRRTPTPHAHKKRLAPHIFTYSPSLIVFSIKVCAIATARFHVSGLPSANGNNNDKNSANPINELKTAEAAGVEAVNDLQVAYLKAFKDTSADENG